MMIKSLAFQSFAIQNHPFVRDCCLLVLHGHMRKNLLTTTPKNLALKTTLEGFA